MQTDFVGGPASVTLTSLTSFRLSLLCANGTPKAREARLFRSILACVVGQRTSSQPNMVTAGTLLPSHIAPNTMAPKRCSQSLTMSPTQKEALALILCDETERNQNRKQPHHGARQMVTYRRKYFSSSDYRVGGPLEHAGCARGNKTTAVRV